MSCFKPAHGPNGSNGTSPTLLEPCHQEQKATVAVLLLWGIFAVIKPSGPTSTSLLARLRPLFSSSRLFVPGAGMYISRMGSKYPGPTPTTDKKQLEKDIKHYIKLGSAGTLRIASLVRLFRYHYFTVEQVSHTMAVIGVGSGTKDLGQSTDHAKVRSGTFFSLG